jgi:hypothetical protein
MCCSSFNVNVNVEGHTVTTSDRDDWKNATAAEAEAENAMTQLATAQTPNAATDTRIDPQIRAFLAELNTPFA